jgi:hypothetical protein
VLYALWCLQDVERVDELESRLVRAKEKTMMPFTDGGVKNLNDELATVQREIRTPFGKGNAGMSLDQLMSFPGMPNQKKGNVS